MARFKLLLEYDGTPFVGWQRQANGVSVQSVLEEAIFIIEGRQTQVRGAGRTDAGVHASGQCAHADFLKPWHAYQLREALNAQLRAYPVAVLAAELVADEFDARFSAVMRHYRYRIHNRPAPLALERQRGWLVKRPLDTALMQKAAQCLLGQHDFSTFRDSECQAQSPIRTLERFEVRQDGSVIDLYLSARSFLHRQVRSMVGSLEQVGSGRWHIDELVAALQARDRARCGRVAPACGLFLIQVDYP